MVAPCAREEKRGYSVTSGRPTELLAFEGLQTSNGSNLVADGCTNAGGGDGRVILKRLWAIRRHEETTGPATYQIIALTGPRHERRTAKPLPRKLEWDGPTSPSPFQKCQPSSRAIEGGRATEVA